MILVFGATGFTGSMVVRQLCAMSLEVTAAARSAEKLAALAGELGVRTVVADVAEPGTLNAAAKSADVLLTTVGPYSKWGHVAADAALAAGIPYVDATGEPGWLRRMFRGEYAPRAAEAGIAMIPAIGYDYVPGNLAGSIALEHAGSDAVRVDVGYFLDGRNPRTTQSFSRGTLDSLKESAKATQFAFRGGRLTDVPKADRKIEFEFDGVVKTAVSIGSTEHFSLPRLAPQLAEVNAGLGWFGDEVAGDEPGQAGPDDDTRDRARTRVVAIARDATGSSLARVDVDGPNPYDLTGLLMAHYARAALNDELTGCGVLDPIESVGPDRFKEICAASELTAD